MKRSKLRKRSKAKRLKHLADKVFSEYIRQRDKGICYTCGNKKNWKQQQCGHYISRNYLATRYDEQNNHCQCVSCNLFHRGRMAEYAIALEKQYGQGILQKLNDKKLAFTKLTTTDYENIVKKYKNKTPPTNGVRSL